MALIRSSNSAVVTRQAIVLDLGDLREQAEEMLRRARAEAASIIAAARVERLQILAGSEEQGRAEGMAKGLVEGRQKGREEAMAAALVEHREALTKIEDAWTGALGEFAARRDDLVQGASRDVLRLAVLIAERVVKRTIAIEPRVVQDQLAAVLNVVVRPTELVVRINPQDRVAIERALPGLMSAMPAIKHAEIVDDAAVERGGCLARTRGEAGSGDAGGGEIDARIGVQLDRIVETLLPRADGDAPEGPRTW